MKYLLCELDDENYADPKFSWYNSLLEAKEAVEAQRIDIKLGKFEPSYDYKGNLLGYRYDRSEYDDFYVNQIIPVSEGNPYLLIHHHAYDGVDFMLEGRYETEAEAQEEMEKRITELEDMLVWSARYENLIDTGTEWEVWSIERLL